MISRPSRTLTTGGDGLPIRRQWAILGVVGALALLLLFGLPWLGRLFAPPAAPPAAAMPAGSFQATDEQWAALGFHQVRLAVVRPQIETDGKIALDDDLTTQVFSPYSGRVTRIFVKAGDRVKAGQPLFEIQASEFAQGQSDLAAAAAQERLAQANETRQHALYQSAGGPLKDWQQSQSDLAAAKAALQAVRSRLNILGKSAAEITALEHEVAASGGTTTVPSPIDGVVTQRLIGPGQTIGSVTNGGGNPAFVVSDLSKIWLVANVRESDAAPVQPGQPIEVRVSALTGRSFSARIDYVSPTIDPSTRRMMVRATLSNPQGLLKPEMFASFSLATGPSHAAIIVPENAVIFEGDTARVWIAHPAGKTLELRQITAGPVVDSEVEVTAGLSPGDQVVSSGALFIDRASKPD